MNALKLTIDPYKGLNTVNINEKKLSVYNEFNNYLIESVLVWADKFCEIIEREINDDYNICVVGEPFDLLFFEDLVTNNNLCQSYSCGEYSFASSVDKRYTVVRSLAAKYTCTTSESNYKIPVFADSGLSFKFDTDASLLKAVSEKDAFLIVTEDARAKERITSFDKPVLAVLVSDENRVDCFGKSRYLWSVTAERLNSVIKSIVERFAKIPYIVDAAKELAERELDVADKQVLELSTSIDVLVEIEPIKILEVGQSQALVVKTIPSSMNMPEIKLVSQNPDVIEVDGLVVRARAIGNTQVNVYRNNETEPVSTFKIQTFEDKTVKRIILDRSEPNMGIGRSQKIDMKYEPADAEDSDYIVWSVDRNDIATVDDKGVVTAKGAGRIRVSASTHKVIESVIIDILPNISQMTASATDVKLNKGDTMPISVLYSPAKCFDNSCNWETDNSSVAYVETYNDGSSVIITKEVGECTLTCTAAEGGCNVSCYVKVVDPAEEDKKRKKIVDIACIIAVPIVLILLFFIMILILENIF